MFALKLAFAGLGHLIAHWSIGLIIIAICVAVEFGSGFIVSDIPILAKPVAWIQKYVLFIAIGTALVLFGEWLGASDMATRCDAKAAVVETAVTKAVTNANKNPGTDKFETDK